MDPVSVHKRNIVQRESSHSMAIYTLLTFFIPLFASFYFGAEADNGKYKSALVLPMCSYAMGMAFLIVCIALKLSINYLYLVAFIKSLLGGEHVFFMISFTYVIKTSSPKSLAFRSIVAEILCSIGFISGSIIAGFMADDGLYLKIAIICLGLAVFCIIYSALLITNEPTGEKMSLISQVKSYGDIFKDNVNSKLILLYFFIYCAIFVSFDGYFIANYLFVSGNPFLMNNFYYSLLIVTMGVTGTFIGLGGGLLLHKNVIDLKKSSLLALMLNSLGLWLFGVAKSYLLLFIGSVFISCYIVVLANFKTILSKLVDKDKNGRLFTCIFLTENIISLIVQPVSLMIYAASVNINLGLLFFLLAGILVPVGFVVIYLIIYPIDNV